MADKQSLLRDFLFLEARRRRHWLIGDARLNGAAIARDLGVSQPTISRALRNVRTIKPPSARLKPVRPWQLSGELEDALLAFFGFRSPADLWDAMANAEGSAPPPRRRRRR